MSESKAVSKKSQKLREELAAYQASEIVANAPVENGLRVIVRAWKDRDRDFVKLLASRAASTAPSTVVFFCAEDADPVRVFLARSADLKFNSGAILKEALGAIGLRGGGSPDLAQGEVPAHHEPQLRASILDGVRRAINEPGAAR